MGIKHLTAANTEMAIEDWTKVTIDYATCQYLIEHENIYVPEGTASLIQCYKWLVAWLNANSRGKYFGQFDATGCTFAFSRSSEAVRFKLTFGGR